MEVNGCWCWGNEVFSRNNFLLSFVAKRGVLRNREMFFFPSRIKWDSDNPNFYWKN